MSPREPPRLPDPDDWFAEPERSRRGRRQRGTGAAPDALPTLERAPPTEEDWFAGRGASSSREPRPRFEHRLSDVQFAAVAVAAVAVVIVVVLALAGLFSAGGRPPRQTTAASRPPATPSREPASAPLPAPAGTLKPGDRGVQVRVLQRALARLGDLPGQVDGRYGPATEHAVARFQRAATLPGGGVFGPRTRRALVRALERSTR
jgi:hypothetical protein